MDLQSAFRFTLPVSFAAFGLGMIFCIIRGRKAENLLCAILMFIGCASLSLTAISLWPHSFTSTANFYLGGVVPVVEHLDPLSCLFLLLLGVVGCAAAAFSPSYLKHFTRFHGGVYWFEIFAFVTGMAQLFLVDNAIAFLFFWEVMSIASAGLVITNPIATKARNAALVYLGATRMSTALIFTAFIWLHAISGSWNFASWSALTGAAPTYPLILLFLGLCIKAGVWPFHQWLPYAHPEAPAPVSAMMSGIMVKVAIYTMLRIIGLSHAHVTAIAYIAIAFGMVSAVWGILYAVVMRDLKQLLAYSTVENVGLIILSFGIMLLANRFGLEMVAQLSLAAAIYHIINHSLNKSMLFLCSGAVDSAAHTRDLEVLGGLHKNMPFTTFVFLLGSLCICALPPLNGFVSKWLIYQSVFQYALAGSFAYRAAALVIIAGLSMVGALSVASFTKALGLGFLGRPRSRGAEQARELSSGSIFAQLALAVPCILLGCFAQHVLVALSPVCIMFKPAYYPQGLFTIPQPQLFVCLIALIGAIYAAFLAVKTAKIKFFDSWECGYGALPPRTVIGRRALCAQLRKYSDRCSNTRSNQ